MIRCAGRYATGFSRWLSRYDFKVIGYDFNIVMILMSLFIFGVVS
jgi:hypothetical protein